jgi:hypothetical protein
MDMDQAAVFLGGTILTTLGFLVLIIAIVIVNNVLHKYWKPVRIFTTDSWSAMNPPARYATPEELEKIEPPLEKKK